MNAVKCGLFGAAMVFAALGVNESAHAEGVFGMEMSTVRNGYVGKGSAFGKADASGAEFAVFGQARGDVFGVHASFGHGALSLIPVKHDGVLTKIETLYALDVLGMAAFGDRVKGVGMFGLSMFEWKVTSQGGCISDVCGLSGQDTTFGIRLAGGVESPLGEKWMGQWLIEYTEYGDIVVHDPNGSIPDAGGKVEVDQLAITFRLGYRF